MSPSETLEVLDGLRKRLERNLQDAIRRRDSAERDNLEAELTALAHGMDLVMRSKKTTDV